MNWPLLSRTTTSVVTSSTRVVKGWPGAGCCGFWSCACAAAPETASKSAGTYVAHRCRACIAADYKPAGSVLRAASFEVRAAGALRGSRGIVAGARIRA